MLRASGITSCTAKAQQMIKSAMQSRMCCDMRLVSTNVLWLYTALSRSVTCAGTRGQLKLSIRARRDGCSREWVSIFEAVDHSLTNAPPVKESLEPAGHTCHYEHERSDPDVVSSPILHVRQIVEACRHSLASGG